MKTTLVYLAVTLLCSAASAVLMWPFHRKPKYAVPGPIAQQAEEEGHPYRKAGKRSETPAMDKTTHLVLEERKTHAEKEVASRRADEASKAWYRARKRLDDHLEALAVAESYPR